MSDGVTKRYPILAGIAICDTSHAQGGFHRFVEACTGLYTALNNPFSLGGGVIQATAEDARKRPFFYASNGVKLGVYLVFVEVQTGGFTWPQKCVIWIAYNDSV